MFEHLRPQLKGLAYRMLGSFADAEDMVQEAWLRLHQADPKPDSEEAFLYRVVSNLCVDRLRRLKVERKHYFGPWLPEPVPDSELDVADIAEAAEDLSLGFLLLMESLSPAERVVYVLREAFSFSYTEIGELLEITAATARQRVHRAKARLAKVRKRSAQLPAPDWREQRAEQQHMLVALAGHIANGDVQAMVSMMSEDVVALTDGGGVVSAAIRPITTPGRIAQVAVFLAKKSQQEGGFSQTFMAMNGNWAQVLVQNGVVHSCTQLEVKDGRVWRIYVTRNPHKLRALSDHLGLLAGTGSPSV